MFKPGCLYNCWFGLYGTQQRLDPALKSGAAAQVEKRSKPISEARLSPCLPLFKDREQISLIEKQQTKQKHYDDQQEAFLMD